MLFLLVSATLLLTVACSKAKVVPLLAEQWEVGQHRNCMYGHDKLYCFKPDQLSFKLPFTPYFVESHRDEALKDPKTDSGAYETQFGRSLPVDFSIWDCYKTGKGSPAVSCDLKHQPTADETAAYTKAETDQKDVHRLEESAGEYMRRLSQSDLTQACGEGKQSGGRMLIPQAGIRMNTFIQYPFGKFEFQSLGMHDKTTSQSCRAVSPSCEDVYMLYKAIRSTPTTSVDKVWDLELQIKYPQEALEFVQPIPCLFDQVKLLNSQPEKQSPARKSVNP